MLDFMYKQLEMIQPTSMSKVGLQQLFGLTHSEIDQCIYKATRHTLTTFKTVSSRRVRMLRRGSMPIVKVVGFCSYNETAVKVLSDLVGHRITGMANAMVIYNDGTGLVVGAEIGKRKYNFFVRTDVVRKICDAEVSRIPVECAMAIVSAAERFDANVYDEVIATKPPLDVFNRHYIAAVSEPNSALISESIRRNYFIDIPAACIEAKIVSPRMMEIRGINGYEGSAVVSFTPKS